MKKNTKISDISKLPDEKIKEWEKAISVEKKRRSNKGSYVIYTILFSLLFLLSYLLLKDINIDKNIIPSYKKEDIKITNVDLKHDEMLKYIKSSDYRNILLGDDIRNHNDYKYFFDFIRTKNKKQTLVFENKKSILFNLSKETKTNIIYINKKHIGQSNNSLIITGAYTSSYKRPVGLFSSNGKIINPAIKKWTGILIVKNKKMYIENARNIPIEFKIINIIENFNDYLFFLKWVEKNDISVLQTHMLVDNSKVVVSNKNNKKFRRRVIYEDINNNIKIYDSENKKLTLFDLSNILIKNHKAKKAINLDMGTYDYCSYKKDNKTTNCGYLKDTNILSNLIEISW